MILFVRTGRQGVWAARARQRGVVLEQETRDSLSIFFPAYNDWGTIASMVALAHQTARGLTDDYEVIVVNDASPDHLGQILEEMRRLYPNTLRVITHPTNRGYGGALRSGFAAAGKKFIFYTDGDAQYDVRELALLWEKRAGADLVNGYKIRRSDPPYRAVVGRAYHHFTRMLFRLPVRDVDCDFRLIRSSVFDRVNLTVDSGLICVELMARIARGNYRIAQVPVHHYHRMHGRSQFFNIPRVARVLWGMGGLWWRIFVSEARGSARREKETAAKPRETGG
jgi:glycosyltransferase involved in cell wall biosynthesis